MSKPWMSYEDVATRLLNQFITEFGLDRVEGKQVITGQRSKTRWEIDAKGVRDKDGAFMVVECRRYTTSKPGLTHRSMDRFGLIFM